MITDIEKLRSSGVLVAKAKRPLDTEFPDEFELYIYKDNDSNYFIETIKTNAKFNETGAILLSGKSKHIDYAQRAYYKLTEKQISFFEKMAVGKGPLRKFTGAVRATKNINSIIK